MKALIFAAGRGERLKPLTNHTPKPLVVVRDKPLIQYHIEALLAAGISDLVINVSWLHQQIIDFVTNLMKLDDYKTANIQFSIEADQPLETGGGMLKAMPMLISDQHNPEPFVVVNADIFTDFDFSKLQSLPPDNLVNLVLVNNPKHNPLGDFSLDSFTGNLQLKTPDLEAFTYAGIGLFHQNILKPPYHEKVFSIVPHIKAAIQDQQATGQIHQGMWHDVGTIQRLNELNQW